MVDPQHSTGPQPMTEITRRRRGRSLAILLVLLGVSALFYAITIVKMAHP